MKKQSRTILSALLGTALLAVCGAGTALAAPVVTVGAAEAVQTETETASTLSGTVTTSIDMSSYEKGSTVKAWIPVPKSNHYQSISDVAFEAKNATTQIAEDSEGNQLLYIEWTADVEPEDRIAETSFYVTRQEVIRPDLVEEGTVDDAMSQYLMGTNLVVVTGEVKELADEITTGKTTILEKSRAIYDWIIANMNRDNDVIGCGQGDVCTLINTRAGKCTDINSVFVALCRASGIPAYEMFGVRINADNITTNQHCWAAFYLPGSGWIYADPADVLKAVLNNGWDKSSEETKALQEYYWGNCDNQRVELSVGRDITLTPTQSDHILNYFGYPYAEVDGVAVDYYTPSEFAYSISFVEE